MLHILSHPTDVHALYVQWACQRLGISCQISSMSASGAHGIIQFAGASSKAFAHNSPVESKDAVWFRRPVYKLAGSEALDPADQTYAANTQAVFLEELHASMELAGGYYVNSSESIQRTKTTISQLAIAQNCGLQVPQTLITNDPVAAEAFSIEKRCVLKALHPFMWHSNEETFTTSTALLTADQIANAAETIPACPVFLQEFIDSDDELRVTFIGQNIFCASLNWSNEGGTKVDWKKHGGPNQISPFALPSKVLTAVKDFIRSSGLRFGAIDLVRRGDEYIFLEVNQAGQWIWVEDACPELPLLDCFVKFMIAMDDNYKYDFKQDLASQDYIVESAVEGLIKRRNDFEVFKYGGRRANTHPYNYWEG